MNCDQEVLVLLWQVMEENPVFTQYVLKHCDINEVCFLWFFLVLYLCPVLFCFVLGLFLCLFFCFVVFNVLLQYILYL